ncbi:hypothetical protein V1478_009265 [Vespula squamosa]|uniref:Uncharacterized protein n=1 Tax=Vespula squamosa TaxID=30214 RepID=A0ABD2AP48_VESSQ
MAVRDHLSRTDCCMLTKDHALPRRRTTKRHPNLYIERYSVCVIVSPICVCLVVRMHHGKCNKRESIDETIRLKARAHSGNYLQIKIPLCTPKYSPLRPLSSAAAVAGSGDGGGGNSSSSNSSSSNGGDDEAAIGADLLSAAPLQYPGCATDRMEPREKE